jgi:hypothetical protein
MRRSTLLLVAFAGAAGRRAGAAAFIWSGLYDISAIGAACPADVRCCSSSPAGSRSATTPRQSPRRTRRPGARSPAARSATGDKCLVCHGGPGVAQGEIGRSMQPLPGPLVDAARRFSPPELYWVVRRASR